jgi:acyl carrier protein
MEKTKIRDFLRKEILIKKSASDFKDSDNLIEMGVIDSLSIMKMVQFLEKEFALIIEDIDLLPENFETIDQIVSFVKNKKLGQFNLHPGLS